MDKYFAGLTLEEMAGNVVSHGFSADNKKYFIDIRVVHKGDDIILRIRDNCIAFDPTEHMKISDSEDAAANIGIKMVCRISKDVRYSNLLG